MVPYCRDETYGDVKMPRYNIRGRIIRELNVLGHNVQGRIVPVPGNLPTHRRLFRCSMAGLAQALQPSKSSTPKVLLTPVCCKLKISAAGGDEVPWQGHPNQLIVSCSIWNMGKQFFSKGRGRSGRASIKSPSTW
jgi:hypothetical protein